MKAKDDDDIDVVTDPKTGGFEKPGAGKDDDDIDVVTEPKTGGFEKPAG